MCGPFFFGNGYPDCRDRRGCGQLFGAQCGPDFAGAGGDIALPATAFERGLDRGQAQPGALLGAGGPAQHPKGVAVGEVWHMDSRRIFTSRSPRRANAPKFSIWSMK